MGCCGDSDENDHGGFKKEGRRCTDLLALLIFLLSIVAYIVIASIAFREGQLAKLIHGADSQGRICGEGSPPEPADLKNQELPADYGSEWNKRGLVWYPITQNITDPKKAIKLGVCVDRCPSFELSPDINQPLGSVLVYDAKVPDDSWPVLYTTKETFGYCLPDLSEVGNAFSEISDPVKDLGPVSAAGSFISRAYVELYEARMVILACVGICVVVSFLWLLVTRFFVKFMVYLSLLLILVLLIAGGCVAFFYGKDLKDRPEDTLSDYATWFIILGIVLWVLAGLYLLLMIYLFRRIREGVAIIRQGAIVLAKNPTLAVLPLIAIILLIANGVWYFLVAIHVETISTEGLQEDVNVGGATISTVHEDPGKARGIYRVATVFMYFWINGFINAWVFLATSWVCARWYFSSPVSKSTPPFSAFYGVGVVLRYHLGTIAMGAAIIAIISTVRWIFARIQKQLVKKDPTGLACCLGCCIQCCLSYIQRIVEFINKNAYVMTAIKGKGFCSAAAAAVKLLVSNILRISTISMLGSIVIFIGKICITAATVLIAYLLLDKTDICEKCDAYLGPLIFIGFVAFFISSAFLGILSSLIYTLILCFCVDMKENDGDNKVYYMTPELQRITGMSNELAYQTDHEDNPPTQRKSAGAKDVGNFSHPTPYGGR